MKLESIKIIAKRYRHTSWKNEEMLEVLAEIERLQKLNEEYRQALLKSGWQERGKDD